MSMLDGVRYRLRTWLRPGDRAREAERELRFHLDLEAAQRRAGGDDAADAEFGARRQLGSLAYLAEEIRWAAGLGWLDVGRQDVAFALRSARRAPGFTLIAVLTLALGVGATTAVFSVIDGVLLRPLPIARPERVLSLRLTSKREMLYGLRELPSSMPQYLRWRDELRSFSAIAAMGPATLIPLGRRIAHERGPRFDHDSNSVHATAVSASFFPLAGVAPVLGRAFVAADDQPTSERTAILAYDYWQRAYGAESDAIGRSIVLDGDTYTIVGVMPRRFVFPENTQVWTTIGPNYADLATNERTFFFDVLGRLRDNVSQATALAEVRTTYANAAQTHDVLRDFVVSAPRVRDQIVARVATPLAIMMAFVGAVLLIAAANVTNMLLARGMTRQHEMAVRLALGAGRARIVRQLLTESLLLALAGALAGIGAAAVIERFIAAQQALDLPRRSLIGLNPLVIVACAVTAGLVGVICGLVPALSVSRDAIESALRRDPARHSASRRRRRLRDLLVAAEVAMAVVLLAGAGLLLKSFHGLMELRPGLSANGVLAGDVRFGLPDADTVARATLARAVAKRLRATPGVSAASVVSSYPFGGALQISDLSIPGLALDSSTHPYAMVSGIDGDDFKALGTHVVRGRMFSSADMARRDVAIINDVVARKYFGAVDPIGHRIVVGGIGAPSLEVVGVVESIRHEGLTVDPEPEAYVPLAAEGAFNLSFVVRADHGNPVQLIPAVERAVKSVTPAARLTDIAPLTELLGHTAARPRVYLILLGGFALAAMLLTAIGLYGVISYSVAQRTREIGIRIALGASPWLVRRSVVRQGLALTLAGVALGGGLALVATRVLRSILYGVSPGDPAVVAVVAALLTAAAAAACWVPARRAAAVDPMVAIRTE